MKRRAAAKPPKAAKSWDHPPSPAKTAPAKAERRGKRKSPREARTSLLPSKPPGDTDFAAPTGQDAHSPRQPRFPGFWFTTPLPNRDDS